MNFYELNQKIQILKEAVEMETEPEEKAGPYYPESPKKGWFEKAKELMRYDVLSPIFGPDFNRGFEDGLKGKPIADRADRENERYFKGWKKGQRIHICKKDPSLC